MELDARKITILKAIIRSYMETGEPVGSRMLSKLPDLSISPATIRNEMSDLEEMGYIVQPHTSAGRIPTDKGYRFYVDELMKEKDTEVAEFKEIVIQRVDRLEMVLRQLAKLLAANTNYATMISGPSYQKSKIRFIQLSRMDESRLLVATVFEGNIINNKIVDLQTSISEQDVSQLNLLLNTSLTGLSANEINLGTITELKNKAGEYAPVIDIVLTELSEAFENADRELEVYTSGATNIFKYPELTDKDNASRIINAFEQKEPIRDMFNDLSTQKGDEGDDGKIKVYIGDELPMEDMKDFSMVTADYEFGEGVTGTIGIMGPKRMDYDKVLGTLRNVMSQLDEQFKLMTGDGEKKS